MTRVITISTTALIAAVLVLPVSADAASKGSGAVTEPPADQQAIAVLATGPDNGADGYLRVQTDEYGSWGSFNANFEDLFNPSGALDLDLVAFTSGFFLFVPDRGQRELLSDIPDWQNVFAPDGSLDRAIVMENVTSDTNNDGVDDTAMSAFSVFGGNSSLRFDLVQSVSTAGSGVALVRQEYTITNESSDGIDFALVRAFDGDLSWQFDFSDDEVGTTMHGAGLGTYVYEQESGIPSITAVTLSGTPGPDYYGGKNGVEPPNGPPAYAFGTDVQVWDAFGVPDSWRTYVAGVGYGVNGNSGEFPPGAIDPADGFIGMDFPVSLGPGERTTVTALHTYGQNSPSGCALALLLDRSVAHGGDVLRFDLLVKHNRRAPARVPFVVSLRNAAGDVVASQVSRPHRFRFGDELRQQGYFTLPASLPQGDYRLVVQIDQMKQDVALASQPLRIIRRN